MLLQVKRYSERLLLPLARKLKKIPANAFTIIGMLSAIVTFIGYYFRSLPWIITFLIIIEFCDQLDGTIARLQGPKLFGAFLDSTLDRIGDFFILIGTIVGSYTSFEIGIIALVGTFLTSYTRARIEALGIENLYGVGLLERTDRIPILLLGTILQLWFCYAIWWTMLVLAIGTNATTIQRIMYAHKKLVKQKVMT
jgi:CDP-diacylglycerol--glycerol-3-phosphate 3-phosphatidyltransferase